MLNQQRSSRRIPGLVAAIIYPDGSIWGGASGQSQLEPSRRSTPYTPYVVGSITKTFIAATIMELVEEGAPALDDPLSDWLPDYPRAADMTLRHLLSHTSGVHNYFEQRTYNTKVFKTMKGHHWAPQEILDTFAEPPYFAPGAGYYYSNTNFILLGMVIEAETGMDLDGVLDERFITPLGLSDTYFQDNAPPPPTAAHGYLLKSSGYKQVSDSTNYRPTISAATVAWAAGAIVASPRDIARWGHELYGGNLLEPESLAEMTDYNYSTYAKGAYGLGTRTRIYDGTRMFGHTGSLRGFVGAMWHYVDADLTIVVLTNRGRIDANPIIDALAAVALAPSRSVAGN
ncbi:serine hydrolase domain-containing protein [soil metagenome]